jgi:hypothetical protein
MTPIEIPAASAENGIKTRIKVEKIFRVSGIRRLKIFKEFPISFYRLNKVLKCGAVKNEYKGAGLNVSGRNQEEGNWFTGPIPSEARIPNRGK